MKEIMYMIKLGTIANLKKFKIFIGKPRNCGFLHCPAWSACDEHSQMAYKMNDVKI